MTQYLEETCDSPSQLAYHVYDVTDAGAEVMGSFDFLPDAWYHQHELATQYPLPGHRYEVRDGLGNEV